MSFHILIVGDKRIVRRRIGQGGQTDSVEITGYSPDDAVRLVRGDLPSDVVVLDTPLPGVEWRELIRHSGPLRPDTRFIVLAHETESEAAREAEENEHVYRLLLKPVTSAELREAVGTAKRSLESRKRLAVPSTVV
jgi:CheY-like chemotaxis protein